MKQFNRNTRQSGFTLIEIIIVVVILGILAAVALPKLTENIDKARAAEAFQFGGAVAHAFERCMANETGGNAPTPANLDACGPAGDFPGLLAALGMKDPASTNFTYTVPTGANPGPLTLLATMKNGAAADVIQFDIDTTTGNVKKTCGAPAGTGVFGKMCK